MDPSIKVAQPGWDANTAPDWALVFSSQWPSLQIAFEKTVVQTPTSGSIIVNHNLGFPPLTVAWVSTSSLNYSRVPTIQVTPTTASIFSEYAINLNANVTYTIRCYNIDISQEVSYPLPQSASSAQAPDLTTGIKIVKQNPTRGINSPNMNDFILNSRCQSPAILNVATQKGQYYQASSSLNPEGTGRACIVYPLQTSFIPFFMSYTYLGANTYQYFGNSAVAFNDNNLILDIAVTGAGSLIVLRDPLFYPNTVRVVF